VLGQPTGSTDFRGYASSGSGLYAARAAADRETRREPNLHDPWYGIGPWAAFKRAFAKYGVFSGRASRSEFWWFYLASGLISSVLTGLSIALGDAPERIAALVEAYPSGDVPASAWVSAMTGSGPGLACLVAQAAWSLAAFIPSFALTFRRLHDTGHSGSWLLFAIVSPIGAFYHPLFGILPLLLGLTLLIFLLLPPARKTPRYP
jgi:uncharacterized membrane protein YhaH (DUF805 family)